MVRFLAFLTLAAALPPATLAASGAEVYRGRCALCHDGGATQAPRVGRSEDWVRRVEKGRAALLRSALEGVRDTAMLPRAGFRELSDGDALRTKVGSVSVEAHEGRELLRGVVESARNVRAAEEIARAVAGVVSVENKLIAADLFEHD